VYKSSWTLRVSNKVDCVWKVMAHAHKPDFVFRWNGRFNLKRQEASVQSTTGSGGERISGSNAGYTMFRSSVKSTGYSIDSPVSPSLSLLCVTVCHHISTRAFRVSCKQKNFSFAPIYMFLVLAISSNHCVKDFFFET
jgi:hypothetical protein